MLGLKRLLRVVKGVNIDTEAPPVTHSEQSLGEVKALHHNEVNQILDNVGALRVKA